MAEQDHKAPNPDTPAAPMTEEAASHPVEELPEGEFAPTLDDRLVAVEAELAETKEHLLRTLADMENLRKRTAREAEEARRYAIAGFARDLVEVAENLTRAVALVPDELKAPDHPAQGYVKGVEMTEAALLATLEKHQVTKIQPEKGERFDHNRHQAMFEVPTAELPAGSIAEIMQSGYAIGDRLLRPALVGVAKAPMAANTDPGA